MTALVKNVGTLTIPGSENPNLFLDLGLGTDPDDQGVYVEFFSTNDNAVGKVNDMHQIEGYLTATKNYAYGATAVRMFDPLDTSDTKSHAHADACILKMVPGGTTTLARAKMGTTGFANGGVYLNWEVVDGSGDIIGWRVFAGTAPKVHLQIADATDAAWAVSGVPFPPQHMEFTSPMRNNDFSVTPTNLNSARFVKGVTDGIKQYCYACHAGNGNNPSEAGKNTSKTKMLMDISLTGSLNGSSAFLNFTNDGANFGAGLGTNMKVIVISSRGLKYYCGDDIVGTDDPLIVTGVPFRPETTKVYTAGVNAFDSGGGDNYINAVGIFDDTGSQFTCAYNVTDDDDPPDARTRHIDGTLVRMNGATGGNHGIYLYSETTDDGFKWVIDENWPSDAPMFYTTYGAPDPIDPIIPGAPFEDIDYFDVPIQIDETKAVASELPNGKYWQAKLLIGTSIYGLVFAMAGVTRRFKQIIHNLSIEFNLYTTTTLITTWESSVGLPDSRLANVPTDLAKKRGQVLQRLKKFPIVTAIEVQLNIDREFPDYGIWIGRHVFVTNFRYDFRFYLGSEENPRDLAIIVVNVPWLAIDLFDLAGSPLTWDNLRDWFREFVPSYVELIPNYILEASLCVITTPQEAQTIYTISDGSGSWTEMVIYWKEIDVDGTVINHKDTELILPTTTSITRSFIDSTTTLISATVNVTVITIL